MQNRRRRERERERERQRQRDRDREAERQRDRETGSIDCIHTYAIKNALLQTNDHQAEKNCTGHVGWSFNSSRSQTVIEDTSNSLSVCSSIYKRLF